MKKYKVEFIETKKFVVDVFAINEKKAIEEARETWGKIDGTEHYYQNGDTILDIGNVFDVSETDDPFNP